MDDYRDVHKTESIAKYTDNQPVRFSPFGDNKSADRLYRKAERIVAALHLLTNHVPDSEPVRQLIRSKSVALFAAMLALRDEMRIAHSRRTVETQSIARELISLVRVLSVSGYISIPNANLMTEALDELMGLLLSSQRSNLSESVSISRDELIDVHGGRFGDQYATKNLKDTSRPSIKDAIDQKDTATAISATSNISGQATARSQNILDTLRGSSPLGIKEIWAHLPEYSEKMIQRELNVLVGLGRVKKVGEKRWSRYSVA
jgi:hypothetical protein